MVGRAHSLVRCTAGAMALTVSQMFLGAISLGIGMFRGTEVYTEFHHETLVAHANFGSSKLAADHARSANVVVNNNVIMTAIMGPRFGVEADNITMDGNAAIACPTCPKSSICHVCKQYKKNKPRAVAKRSWVRAKQMAVWGSLGKLSNDIDRLASMQAGSLVTTDIQRADPRVSIRFEDPARNRDIWGGSNAAVACKLAVKDTLVSPVLGHAFPTLISPNLLEGLPRVLVQAFPEILCAAVEPGSEPQLELAQIRSVADKTRDECRDFEDQMHCAIRAATGAIGACQPFGAAVIQNLSGSPRGSADGDRPNGTSSFRRPTKVVFPTDVEKFVTCQRASPMAPLQSTSGGYAYRDESGQFVTCTFEREKCNDKRLRENSDDYIRKELGLPKIVGDVAAALGGSETRQPRDRAADFCACSYTARPVDETVIGISDAVRKIAGFGAASPSEALRRRREYRSCGTWYFPDRKGDFASVAADEQPFVAAWKWGLVDRCLGSEGP